MNKKILLIGSILIIGLAIYVVVSNAKSSVTTNNKAVDELLLHSNDYYSFKYPVGWWHNHVSEAIVRNAPMSAVNILMFDGFGIGNYSDYKHPYSEDKNMFNMDVVVYSVVDGYSFEDLKNELDINNSKNKIVQAGDYNARLKISDDSNHEIESARMYVEYYFIQDGDLIYEISFASLNKTILDQNSLYKKNILNSFIIMN